MSTPSRPIPDEQTRAFNLAVCKRLGIEPDIIADHNFRADFTVSSGEEFGQLNVSFTAYLPADEILGMFDRAGRP